MNSADASERQLALMDLVRTADAVRAYLTDFYAPYGITPQQYNVLRILRGAGASLPTMDVADRMVEKTPGITRLLDRLEGKRLVRRTRDRDDRRQVVVSVTPRGLALLEELEGPVRGATEAAVEGLSDEELERLGRLLERIRERTVAEARPL